MCCGGHASNISSKYLIVIYVGSPPIAFLLFFIETTDPGGWIVI